jgi:SAM-dependent methyltransferase
VTEFEHCGQGDAHAHTHDPSRGNSWMAAMWEFARAQLPPAPASVVELGCGSLGGFVPRLEQLGYAAVGVDPDAPEGPSYVRGRFEEASLAPADVVLASASLHHVADVGPVLDRVQGLLRPGGAVVVVEWAWERFDERTARWCFERLAGASPDAGWLSRHRERWQLSGRPWSDYVRAWAETEGLHRSEAVVRGLDDRFDRMSLTYGPYFFTDLDDTAEEDEAAAIEAGLIEATCVQYVGRRH